MENFIVSARKYRPATFESVVGQHAITTTLRNAILNNQLAQAFLFCGPRGVGKTTCARILAKTINCNQITKEGEACNECVSCKSFNTSASFNIYELDAASNNSVDDIRTLVDQVRIPPQGARYKVYIIDEVHMLSQSAFNAFLKTLEEPPSYAKFILATTEKHKIIPTVLSRCQIFDFKRISVEDIMLQLTRVASNEGITAEPEALHIIAQKADGAMRDALSIFDQLVSFSGSNITYRHVITNLNVLDYDYYFRLVDAFLTNSVSEALVIVDNVLANGFDGQHFIIGLGEHLRSLLVSQDTATLRLLEAGAALKERYRRQADQCISEFLLKSLEIVNRCDLDYRVSNNKRLLVEMAILQMMALIRPISLSGSKALEDAAGQPQANVKPTPPLPPPKPAEANKPISVPPAELIKKTGIAPVGMPTTTSIKTSPPGTPAQTLPKTDENGADENNYEEESQTAYILQADLEKYWAAFAQSVASESPNLHATLTFGEVRVADASKGVIEYPITSQVQLKEIQDHKSDLIDFLRKKLGTPRLTINTPLVESKSVADIPYTPVEKFRKMLEKNPELAKLKEQLNLDIDY